MDILGTIMGAAGGGAARQLGQQFGLDEDQVQSALGALLPALAGAVNQNTQTEDGLSGLLGALSRGNHQQYLEDPSLLEAPETRQDGNGILGHLLGSKDVSRALASRASAETGIGSDVLKSMLPIVATMLMGSLSKGASQGGLLSALGVGAGAEQQQVPQQSGLLGMLTPLLDRNRDGSALDDILGMAARFMTNR
jgi:hypothetical protein